MHAWCTTGTSSGRSGVCTFKALPVIWERRAPGTLTPQDLALWDAYLLYGPDARWNDQPPDMISWGATILLTREKLARDFKQILTR